jgi:peptidoglycan/LPS O-acetylase OafA/YrhL
MKTKYERMNKDEKKKIVNEYKKTEKGLEMMKRLTRLNIIGVLGILFAIYLYIDGYKNLEWLDYLAIIPLFLASCLFLLMSYKLRKKVLNQFAIKKK